MNKDTESKLEDEQRDFLRLSLECTSKHIKKWSTRLLPVQKLEVHYKLIHSPPYTWQQHGEITKLIITTVQENTTISQSQLLGHLPC